MLVRSAVLAVRTAIAVGCLVVSVAPAAAERLAVTDVRSEPDVADEAGAISLLVRSALVGRDLVVLGAPDKLTLRAAPKLLPTVGADHAVLLDLAREGTGLRLVVAIAGAKQEDPVLAIVRAGDGDITALARGAVEQISSHLKITTGTVAQQSLARLRPYVTALQLRVTDRARGAAALMEANPLAPVTLPAVTSAFDQFAAPLADRALAVFTAVALGDNTQLDAIAGGNDSAAIAAKVLVAVNRLKFSDADQVLAAKTRDELVDYARLVYTASRANDAQLVDVLKRGLSGRYQRAALAMGASVPAVRLPLAMHRAMLAIAEKPGAVSPGLAARLGLAVALHDKVQEPDLARALALISIRELDSDEIAQVESLLANRTDPSALRLRAELAMRRADGSELLEIPKFLAAAPKDPRAQRYQAWQLMAQGKAREAADVFRAAGFREEQARALAVAGDPEAALAALGKAPSTPEQRAIAAWVDLKAGKIDDAVKMLDLAEEEAPASPVIHSSRLILVTKREDPEAAKLARRIVDLTARNGGDQIEGAGNAVNAKAKDLEAASKAAPVVTELDLDPAPLLPMLQALPELMQIQDGRITLAMQPYDPPFYGLRRANVQPVQQALARVLAAPPYNLDVQLADAPITKIDAAAAGALTSQTSIALVVRAAPSGNDAAVMLTLFRRGAAQAKQVDRSLSLPGVISWNTDKIFMIVGTFVLLLLVGLVWFTRASSTIVIEVERSPDVADEVLCVEVSKSPARPAIGEPEAFHVATQRAGAITKPRTATLIASGHACHVTRGKWYVHLYGTFMRGNELRRVPESCSTEVEVERGGTTRATFSLVSKLAEVRVVMESEPKRGVSVWVNGADHAKYYTDDKGEAKLELPVGIHTLTIEAQGKTFERELQIVSTKLVRFPFNLARELRFAEDKDLVLDNKASRIAPPPSTSDAGPLLELSASSPKVATRSVAHDQTQAVGSDPGDGPSITIRKHPRPATPQPGALLLGRYKVVSELGRGAMGVVHRAFDEKLEREVAIKEIADELRAHPEAMRLFTQEAKALAQLNHTNIVSMYDQVTEQDRAYMIMEFVDGKPLEALLVQRGRFPWREAVALIDQVCAGLAYAHARNVIHRDIKPANIFVTADRTAKLGDFGLARVVREMTIRKTQVRGTPLYMAPEQITGTDVDHRVDLYAVGCTLFELVCGRPPFIDGDILYAQMHADRPSARSFEPSVPAALDSLVTSLIAKSADDRPGSANEVRAALKSL